MECRQRLKFDRNDIGERREVWRNERGLGHRPSLVAQHDKVLRVRPADADSSQTQDPETPDPEIPGFIVTQISSEEGTQLTFKGEED